MRATNGNARREPSSSGLDIAQLHIEGAPGRDKTAAGETGEPGGKPDAARLGPISMAVPRGGYHLVTGPSGSGKSLLMSVIALDRAPGAGRVSLLGEDVSAIGRRGRIRLRRRLGLMTQDSPVIAGSSLLDAVLLPLRLTDGEPDRRAVADARELLHWVGLGGREDDPADTLSAGESRCLDLARALIRRPEVLAADEPTAGLDERSAWRMTGLVEQLHRQGTTVIVATNDRFLLDALSHPRTELPPLQRRMSVRRTEPTD